MHLHPDRARLACEAAALDEQLGALLIEAIEPGTPLVDSSTYPDLESVAELLSSL